ncbi:MAG: NAD(P)/FAD-dependent oxidoreductase [Eubacterium sp.]
MKYVIIGASAAGLATAESIRKNDKSGEITVITKEECLPYSRPSISYYLKGKVNQGDMLLRKQSYYKANNINVVTGVEAKEIDTENKTVKAGRKSYPYDKLCLATGSKPFVPPMKNVEGKANVYTFLDFASAKAVKQNATGRTRAVVIGGGLIGMKAAEGLSKICKSVDVIEFAPRILPSILDEKSAKSVKKYIEKEGGIKFHLQDTIVEAKSKGKTITSVILKSGRELKCDMLIVAVGVRPETAPAEKAGLEVNRGIITDTQTMQTSNPDIYACGDCCVSTDMLDGTHKIIALWPNAVQQGIVAGSQMTGGDQIIDGTYSVNAIDFYGLRICTCGLINAQGPQYCDKVKICGDEYKRLVFEGDRLVGFVLINCSDNAGIYTALIANRVDLSAIQGDIMDTPSLFMFDKTTRTTKLTGNAQGVRL